MSGGIRRSVNAPFARRSQPLSERCRRSEADIAPTGFVSFQANGLMIVAMTDSRAAPIEGPRGYASYCGSYTFDGTRLITDVEDGSSEVWRRTPQIRDVRFEGEFMILSPPAGALDRKGITRELTWERIASNPE
jgi:hypothetical protein